MKNKNVEHIADLIVECRKGNKIAQYQLFNQYYENMFFVCNRIVPNKTDAEEIVQDAFVNAFLNIKKLKVPTAFGSWLKHIVVNLSINFIKRYNKIKWEELSENLAVEKVDENDNYKLNKEVVAAAVAQLPEGCRIIFVLHLIENYKHHEIANMLKVSVSTSKSQYQRAKLILKKKLIKMINE